jgi:hypothetical protein
MTGTARATAGPDVATSGRLARGVMVVVDDGCRLEARIVVVIGVVAVVVQRSEDAGEACWAVPVRCCRPAVDESPSRGGGSLGSAAESLRPAGRAGGFRRGVESWG